MEDVVEIHVRGPPPGKKKGGRATNSAPKRPLQVWCGWVGKVLLQRLFNLEPEQGAFKVPWLALSVVLRRGY